MEKLNLLKKMVQEELARYLGEDSIVPSKTRTADIIWSMKDCGEVSNVVKLRALGNGSVGLIVGKDGKKYEVIVRPYQYGEFKDILSDSDAKNDTIS
jgi:hypothetical protein